MSRHRRLGFEGAPYHLTSRGDRCEPVCKDDKDCEIWLEVWAGTLGQFEAPACANHYHDLLQIHCTNLSPDSRGSGLISVPEAKGKA